MILIVASTRLSIVSAPRADRSISSGEAIVVPMCNVDTLGFARETPNIPTKFEEVILPTASRFGYRKKGKSRKGIPPGARSHRPPGKPTPSRLVVAFWLYRNGPAFHSQDLKAFESLLAQEWALALVRSSQGKARYFIPWELSE